MRTILSCSTIAGAALALTMLAAPASADCASDLRATIEKSDAAFPRRAEMVSRSKAGETRMTILGESPERLHTRTVTPAFTSELLLHDGKGWTSQGKGWTTIPGATAGKMAKAVVSGRTAMLATVKNQECLGEQNRDGKTYQVFKMTTEFGGVKSDSTFYVDPASGLVMQSDYAADMKGDKTTGTMVYTYDASINVAPPK